MESLIKELPRLILLQNRLARFAMSELLPLQLVYGIAVPASRILSILRCFITSRAGRDFLPIAAHFVLAIGLPAPGCSADGGSLGAFSAGIATRNCHRVLA